MSSVNNSSMKEMNRFQSRLNSFRQISNLKWEQLSNIYAKFLLRFSWSILSLSLTITIGLTLCFFLFMEVRNFDQNDFIVQNGPAMKNAIRIKEVFGDDSGLRVHQQLNLYPALDIIIRRKVNGKEKTDDQTNVLNDQVLEEVHRLNEEIQSIRIRDGHNHMHYNFSVLCAKTYHTCNVDGDYMLTEKFRQDLFHLSPPKYGFYFHSSGASGLPGFMFGKDYRLTDRPKVVDDYQDDEEQQHEEHVTSTKVPHPTENKIISYASLLRLRYSLNISTAELNKLSIAWEREALRYITNEFESKVIELTASTSMAIPDAITKKAHDEGIYFMLMFSVFFVLLCFFLSIQGNFHTSVGYLPLCGIISIGLSTGATFGLISIFRIKIIEPMALLIFIVAIIECMRSSIVCGEYHRIIREHLVSITDISSEIDVEKILPSIIQSTHPYFIMSTLMASTVYLLFAIFSPIPSTMFLSLTLALYLVVNYIVHSTFFTSCFVITLKRVSSRRHCLFCCRLPKDYYAKSKQSYNRLPLLKSRIQSLLQKDTIWKSLLVLISCLSFLIFVVLSLWFALSINTSLFDSELLPNDAHSLRAYIKAQMTDFDIGPMVMFTIPKPVDYQNEQIRSNMYSLIKKCQSEARANLFNIIWLDYENVASIIKETDPRQLESAITPFSKNNLIVSAGVNYSTIVASRFYCQLNSIRGDREDINTMNRIYGYTKQSSIPNIFAYSQIFINNESLQQLRVESCLLVFALILCCSISTFLAFISYKNSLLIVSHLLALSTGSLTCLYFFHNLTFNFANACWLHILPILFMEMIVHSCYNQTNGSWKYNRVILSLFISSLFLCMFTIQTYTIRIIRNSLIYQSVLCFIFINFVLPSWFYLFRPKNKNNMNSIDTVMSPAITFIVRDQSLANGTDMNSVIGDRTSVKNISSSI